jgi:hypothetical protein
MAACAFASDVDHALVSRHNIPQGNLEVIGLRVGARWDIIGVQQKRQGIVKKCKR